MFSRNIRCVVNYGNTSCSPVSPVSCFCEERSFDCLYYNEFIGSSTGEKVFSQVNDVQLLLMQKDLEKRHNPLYQSFYSDIVSKVSSLKTASKPKMTDEQLLSFVKSRHVQQPSEVKAWFDYLTNQFDIVKSEYDFKVNEIKEALDDAKKQSDTTPIVEPPKTE